AGLTSRWWQQQAGRLQSAGREGLRLSAVTLAGLIFLQLVIGAHLRHLPVGATAGGFKTAVFFHLLLAAVILGYALLVVWRTLRLPGGQLRGPAILLNLLVLAQIGLGAATWVLKYSWPAGILADHGVVAGWTNTAGGGAQSVIVTGHVAIGSLLLGLAVQLSLRAWRLTSQPGLPRLAAAKSLWGGVG
ncbi:MAG: hypothetical protein GTO53_06815, partial [Planctomycetales bacterium]|nr:hypothetical protein [Planctomycetales bacterium]NIM08848.1 hypothetical protein [Planctomycetales bacterium]NIN08311.1 hypothetical protein [Planctomycetales bacterium]NIN77440.1 hypothetical protein [Planctomycetales bacterium]NIO34612.1 hypothetical protein [Planctomycetales bacterium]